MKAKEFRESLKQKSRLRDLALPLAALWWDAKGDWTQAHGLVDELETPGRDGGARLSAPQRGLSVECRLLVRACGDADFIGRRWKGSGRRCEAAGWALRSQGQRCQAAEDLAHVSRWRE